MHSGCENEAAEEINFISVSSEDYKQEIIINGIGPSPIISFYWFFKSYIKASVVIHPSETFKSAGKLWIIPLK